MFLSIPNLTTVVRDTIPARAGEIAVDCGVGTGYRVHANLWLPGSSLPVRSIPAQRAVEAWARGLRQLGLKMLSVSASIPLPWQRDLVDDLSAEDVSALVDDIIEVAYGGATALRSRSKLDLVLEIDSHGNETVTALGDELPRRPAADRAAGLEIYSICSRWIRDHADWLSQHTDRARFLVSASNPAASIVPARR